MTDVIDERLQAVRTRIVAACERSGRDPARVRLIGVSKKKPVEAIKAAFLAGLHDFGENYVQEFVEKHDALQHSGITPQWHFIGQLQSRKVRLLKGRVGWIHSVDRESQVKEIAKRFEQPVSVLIEVKLGNEPQKGGVAPDVLNEFAEFVAGARGIRLRGLMTIPPVTGDPEASRPFFRELARLLRDMRNFFETRDIDTSGLTELSMGMSQDFEQAIEEGATMVRVGTAIFGKRE